MISIFIRSIEFYWILEVGYNLESLQINKSSHICIKTIYCV